MVRSLLAFLCLIAMTPMAFSQSADFQPGDRIRVTADAARIMAGETVLGTSPKGTELNVEKVQNGWLMVKVTIGGQAKSGWIKASEVTKAAGSVTGSAGAGRGVKLRFAAREAAVIKAGDTIVVNHPEGTKLWVDGFPLKNSEAYDDNYILQPDTRLKVDAARDQSGSLFPYQVTINFRGKPVTGAVEINHVVRLQEYLAGDRRRDRFQDDRVRQTENVRRNLPRLDVSRDFPAKLYGTTDIRQGFFRKAAFNLADPAVLNSVPALQYFNLARDDSDFGTMREPETEQLLKIAASAPTAVELLPQCQKFLEGALQPLTDAESDQIEEFRSKLRTLRAEGKYSEAEPVAKEFVEWCESHTDKAAPLSNEAHRQVDTIADILKLSPPSRAEVAEADGAGAVIRARYQAGLFVAPLLWARDQYDVRRQHLGEDHPDTISSALWLAHLHRMGCLAFPEKQQAGLLLRTRNLFGERDALDVLGLNNLALIRWDRSDYTAADSLLRLAIATCLQSSRGEQYQLAMIAANLGKVLEDSGKMSDARPWFEFSRGLTRKLPRRERDRVVAGLMQEADATPDGPPLGLQGGVPFRPNRNTHVAFGVTAQVGRLYEPNDAALRQTRDVDAGSMAIAANSMVGMKKPDRAQELQNAALGFMARGDLTNTERFLRESAALTRAKLKTNPEPATVFGEVMGIVSFAMILQSIGNDAEAISTMNEAIVFHRQMWNAKAQEKRAELVAKAGTSELVHATFELSFLDRMLNYQGQIQLKAGDYSGAERAFRESLEVAQATDELKEKIRAHTDRVLNLDMRQDDLYSHRGDALRGLAQALEGQGKLPEAERVYREALKSDCDRWAFTNNQQQMILWTGLGTLLMRQNDPARLNEAGPLLRDGMWFAHRRRKMPGQARVTGSIKPYVSYAEYLRRTARPAEAVQVLDHAIRAIDQYRSNSGGDELDRARTFSALLADSPYREMVRLQLSMGEDFTDGYRVESTGAGAAFDALEQGRGRALLDLLGRGQQDVVEAALDLAKKQNNSALLDRVNAVQQQEQEARATAVRLNQQLAAIRQGGSGDPVEAASRFAGIQQSLKEANDAERQARRELFNMARGALTDAQTQPFDHREVASLLKEGEMLLAFDVGPQDSVLLIVRPGAKVEGRYLKWPNDKPVTLATLAGTVAEFFDEISRETNEAAGDTGSVEVYDPAALRAALLPDALLGEISKARRLFVMADGPLHRLPFETLFADAGGKDVVLDALPATTYGPSATVLLKDRQLAPSEKTVLLRQLVAIGDPTFSRETAATGPQADTQVIAAAEARTRAINNFGTLAPLPGTRGEVNAIAALVRKLPGANDESLRLLTGDAATVTQVFQEANQPRFLHLATHGLAEGGRKAYESALALAAPEQVTADDTGFLRLADLLYKWGGKLHGTELVTLSACRTARGQMESGDGFVALTWGFLYAGTKGVVASLWEVDDTATALLMSRFYENLLGTFEQPRKISNQAFEPGQAIPASVALRDAKLWLRHLNRDNATARVKELLGDKGRVPSGDQPFADPFYWGAFVLIGNSD